MYLLAQQKSSCRFAGNYDDFKKVHSRVYATVDAFSVEFFRDGSLEGLLEPAVFDANRRLVIQERTVRNPSNAEIQIMRRGMEIRQPHKNTALMGQDRRQG